MTILDNFKEGDLLYGLEATRDKYRRTIVEAKNVPFKGTTVDHYNNALLYRFLNDEQCYIADKFENVIAWVESEEFTTSGLKPVNAKNHILALFTDVAIFPTLSITNDNLANKDHERNIDLDGRKLRRACKARLANTDTKIHFILDDINVKETFARSKRGKKAPYFDGFTSSELRFVIKNYDHVKDHVTFYLNGVEIDLPQWMDQQSDSDKSAFLAWCKQKKTEIKFPEPKLKNPQQSQEEKEKSKIAETKTIKLEHKKRRLFEPGQDELTAADTTVLNDRPTSTTTTTTTTTTTATMPAIQTTSTTPSLTATSTIFTPTVTSTTSAPSSATDNAPQQRLLTAAKRKLF